MTDNLKQTYLALRSEFYRDGIVFGTKNKQFDFIVFSFKNDKYVKLVKHKEKASIDNYLYYMRGIADKRRNIKIIYVLIYLDRNYQEEDREYIEIN